MPHASTGRRRFGNLSAVTIAFLVASLAAPRAVAVPLDAPVTTPIDLVPRTVSGAGGPKIAVVVVSLDAKAAAQQGALEGAAEEALVRAARFTVFPGHDAFNPAATQRRTQGTADAAEKMKGGKQALDDLDNVKATESFSAALETLQQADLSKDFAALLDAWSMKAASHATGGETAPAKKDMEAIIGLNARAEFSPTFFSPDLIKFAEAQKKAAANSKGELLVRTEPAGARVWVDGVFRGISPVTVAGLSATKHFVTASLGGYALAQTQATPGEEVISLPASELGPGWKRAVTDIKKDPEGPTRDQAAQSLGRAAQLDQVLLVVAKKSPAGEKFDLIALRLEVRDQHNAAYKAATVSPGDPEALAGFFDSLTGRDQKRDGKDPVHHFKGGGGNQIKTIAGISLLGLAAAGLVSGIVFGVLAANDAAAFKTTPQTQRLNSTTLENEGRAFGAVADISYGVGILAAAGGTVLLLTNNGGGGDEPAPATEKKKADTDKRAAEERRASEARAKEDERRREEERKREEDRKKQNAADKDKDAEARAAEEKKKADEEEAKKKADEEAANKKLSKKEQRALEKKKKEEEEARRKEEERQRKEDEKRAKEEERQRKEDEKKKAEEDKKKADEEAAASKKSNKKDREAAEKKAKEEEEAAAKKKAEEDAAAKKAEEEERRKKEEEEKKKKEAEKKKKDEDHDDLRNF
ncbi:MAG: PEGA domain-containing protein [Myxococcaceae bacterium]